MKKTVIGYMDKVDFDEELGRAIDGNRVYPSEQALRAAKPCTSECGIVEVRVTLTRVIQETDFSERIKKTKRKKNVK